MPFRILTKEEYESTWLERILASERSWMAEDFINSGGKFHAKKSCKETRKAGGPKNCVIHRPSEHRMVGWPMIVRASTLIERRCKHGIGHPDPDSVAFLEWSTGQKSWGVHGCDGCCAPRVAEFIADPGWPPQDEGY